MNISSLFQTLPRRRFLQFSLSAAATVSGLQPLWALDLQQTSYYSSNGSLLSLEPAQAEILAAVIRAVLPVPESHTKPSAQPEIRRVIQRIDEELFFISPDICADFKLAIESFDYLPLIYGKFSRFRYMSSKQDRLDLMQSAMRSSIATIRVIALNIRTICYMFYYGDDQNWGRIQYDGSFSRLAAIPGEQREMYAELCKAQPGEKHNA